MPKKSQKSHTDAADSDASKTRRIKQNRHKSFKLEKRIKPDVTKLPNVWQLLKASVATLYQNWRLFSGIVLIYGLLSLVLVYGLNVGTGIVETKAALDETFTDTFSQLAANTSLFLQMFDSTSAATNQAAGVYQFVLTITVSMALIWALRQIYAKNKVRVRDAFYRGMYPLATFVIVLTVIAIQLLPAITGIFLYDQVMNNGIAVTGIEVGLWASLAIVLAIFSLYMVSSSLFALYIVCLPDMTPLKALRSARNLVRYRRWAVMRKVIFMPAVIIIAEALLVIPILLVATPVAPWIFLILNMAAIAVLNSYMYKLYRSLL